jgi:hypothetical protein
VVGVVESIDIDGTLTTYNVVTLGSLKYPSSRLTSIQGSNTQSGSTDGGYDVLFLDANVAGGLTGIAPREGVAKVVAQTAPHGEFNTLVINYIGYEVGTSAIVNFTGAQVGTVGTIPKGTELGEALLDASSDQLLSITEYPELYSVIGTEGKYWEQVILTENTVINGSWNDLLNTTTYQLVSGVRYAAGIIKQVDEDSRSIWVEKEKSQPLYDTTKALYALANFGNIIAYIDTTAKSYFTLPAIPTAQVSIGTKEVIPYIVAKPSAITYIPKDLTVESLSVKTDSLVVNERNILDEIDQIKTLLDQINTFYNL